MISTSEIKISVVIDAKYGELAVRALHAGAGRGRPPRRRRRERGDAPIEIYDTTLRDGCQAEDIALTLEDKLRIAERLDDFGVALRRGRLAGLESARRGVLRAKSSKLHAEARIKVAAFGSTRRAGVRASEDAQPREAAARRDAGGDDLRQELGAARARRPAHPAGGEPRGHPRHASRYLKRHVDEVIFDAEHFFDGFRAQSRVRARVLCASPPTPAPICSACARPTAAACRTRSPPASMPCARRCRRRSASTATTTRELAVANSLIAVEHGAVQVQGTINGIGERCGNVNLCSVIANLQLKMGYQVVSAGAACAGCASCRASSTSSPTSSPTSARPTSARAPSRTRAACTSPPCSATRRPTSTSIRRWSATASACWCPTSPGAPTSSTRRKQFGVDVEQLDGHVRQLVDEVKQLEHQGYQFEGAEASLELRMHRVQHGAAALLRARSSSASSTRRATCAWSSAPTALPGEDRRAHRARPGLGVGGGDDDGPNGEIEHTAARGQRAGERARHGAAHGAAPLLSAASRRCGCSTTRCACSAAARAAPRRCAC